MDSPYYEIIQSSKEIMKNKQRHLYCNMLDLLNSTCKSSHTPAVDNVMYDELVRFWLADILPLIFDEDFAIQSNAVEALERGLSMLNVEAIHGSSNWTAIKNDIVGTYAPRLHKLREARNQHWHKIWCIFVRVLDREILKGATTINSFLSIVELGFRNTDNNVRAEAFFCWRLLIEIFSTYDQLSSPKRMKLICIPLKSSQSKSPHTAAVKLRVWWYFFTCLGQRLDTNFDSVVEPFLVFTFGAAGRSVPGIAQQYVAVRKLALLCLATLVSTESNGATERQLRESNLEILCQPSPLAAPAMLKQHSDPIVYAVVEAVRLIIQDDATNLIESEQHIFHLLLKFLLNCMLRLDDGPICARICAELTRMLTLHQRPITFAISTIATEGLRLERSLEDLDNYATILGALVQLFVASKAVVPPAMLQRCIDQVFTLDSFQQERWRAVSTVLKLLLQTKDDEDYESFETKLLIWRRVSHAILDDLRDNKLDYRLAEHSEILDIWILWPLRLCVAFAGRRTTASFDVSFCAIWKQLLHAGHNAKERQTFLHDLNQVLLELLASGREEAYFADLFDAYAAAVTKYGYVRNSKHYQDLFSLLDQALTKALPQKSLQSLLNTARNIIVNFKPQEISSLFDSLKVSLASAAKLPTKGLVEASFIDEWKRVVLEKLRSHSNKKFLMYAKEIFKSNDVFVIIPSVWSLNPDKLTERQKERFSEKANIPALYNDMSQSEEAPIKPWTPKKVVLAKDMQSEIVLGGSDVQREEREPAISPQTPVIQRNSLRSKRKEAEIEDERVTRRSVSASPQKSKSPSTNNSVGEALSKTDSRLDNDIILVCDDSVPNTSITDLTKMDTEPDRTEPKDTEQEPAASVHKEVPQQAVEANIDLTACEIMQAKEVSPKKTTLRCTPLSSPPDRKLTNNSSSPKLRPKPAALTGRGAQLINMIRNKKNDISAQCSSSTLMSKTNFNSAHNAKPTDSHADNAGTDLDVNLPEVALSSTPIQLKDLLTFTKRLPSPSASPSASILKRSMRHGSIEDMSIDSPASKRKRVSFHDPPVSVTKEYMRDTTETKVKPKRCLVMEKVSAIQGSEVRHMLKRRSKLESMTEIERYSPHPPSTPISSAQKIIPKTIIVGEEPKEAHTFDNVETCQIGINEATNDNKEVDLFSPEKALDYVSQHYSLETILDRYLSTNSQVELKSATVLAKTVSECMSSNTKIKTNILETLSENHSKDFLDHAIQENLASVVCDRLNLNSVLEYICAKSKINTSCRNNLFSQIPDILKCAKLESERLDFIKTIVQSGNFSDADILDLIALLMHLRANGSSERSSENVSESAIDSSSNL